MEDYLEKIYELIKTKGYARVSDIAAELNLQPSSVTKMVQKLAEQDFLIYERYRGLILTPSGEALGKSFKQRHRMLEKFLNLLGVAPDQVHTDVEGIEHHVSPATMEAISTLVAFFEHHQTCLEEFEAFQAQQQKAAEPQ